MIMGVMTTQDQAGWPITVVVPIRFSSSREAARFIQRALVNALSKTSHVVDPVIFYEVPDGRTIRATEAIQP
jgi:hypothetical protein